MSDGTAQHGRREKSMRCAGGRAMAARRCGYCTSTYTTEARLQVYLWFESLHTTGMEVGTAASSVLLAGRSLRTPLLLCRLPVLLFLLFVRRPEVAPLFPAIAPRGPPCSLPLNTGSTTLPHSCTLRTPTPPPPYVSRVPQVPAKCEKPCSLPSSFAFASTSSEIVRGRSYWIFVIISRDQGVR